MGSLQDQLDCLDKVQNMLSSCLEIIESTVNVGQAEIPSRNFDVGPQEHLQVLTMVQAMSLKEYVHLSHNAITDCMNGPAFATKFEPEVNLSEEDSCGEEEQPPFVNLRVKKSCNAAPKGRKRQRDFIYIKRARDACTCSRAIDHLPKLCGGFSAVVLFPGKWRGDYKFVHFVLSSKEKKLYMRSVAIFTLKEQKLLPWVSPTGLWFSI